MLIKLHWTWKRQHNNAKSGNTCNRPYFRQHPPPNIGVESAAQTKRDANKLQGSKEKGVEARNSSSPGQVVKQSQNVGKGTHIHTSTRKEKNSQSVLANYAPICMVADDEHDIDNRQNYRAWVLP